MNAKAWAPEGLAGTLMVPVPPVDRAPVAALNVNVPEPVPPVTAVQLQAFAPVRVTWMSTLCNAPKESYAPKVTVTGVAPGCRALRLPRIVSVEVWRASVLLIGMRMSVRAVPVLIAGGVPEGSQPWMR